MSGALPLILQHAFMAWTRQLRIFTFRTEKNKVENIKFWGLK